MKKTNHHPVLAGAEPDPIELARRIAEDPPCIRMAQDIAELEALESRRDEEIAAACVPLKEEIRQAEVERTRLLKLIRRNEERIRTIKEKKHKRPDDILKQKRHLSKRKKGIQKRYVLSLLAAAREVLDRRLPVNPIIATPPTTPTPI